MSSSSCNEDADIRVGVAVRPLRGEWRTVNGKTHVDGTRYSSPVDPSVWKNVARDYDNEAKVQFISKMVYSNHKLNEGHRYETEVMRLKKQKVRHSTLREKEKNAITINSSPPEFNRIKLPQGLDDEDQDAWAAKSINKRGKEKLPTPTQTWTENSKACPRDERFSDQNQKIRSKGRVRNVTKSPLLKDTSDNPDSSEEIRVTTSPLPKPVKTRPLKTSEEISKAEKPTQNVTTNAEKQPLGKDNSKIKTKLSIEKSASLKDSDRLRVKFDLQDASKNYYGGSYSLQNSNKPSRPGSPKWKCSENPMIRPETPPPRERMRPIRPNLTTTSRSRLKTVTYKEETFMSEFKSWVLLIIFLSMILLYRSTLFS